MIEVYAFATPNSVKVPIALEELGVPYHLNKVEHSRRGAKGARIRRPECERQGAGHRRSRRPRRQADHRRRIRGDPHLSRRKVRQADPGRSRPARADVRVDVLSRLGPRACVQPIRLFPEACARARPAAIERFSNEAKRTLGVLDRRLGDVEYLAGSYSLADIVNFGWLWRGNLRASISPPPRMSRAGMRASSSASRSRRRSPS